MNKIFYLILLIFTSSNLYSQYNDFGIWTNVGLAYKINKQFDVKYNFGYRTEENSRYTERNYNELAVEYDVFEFMELSIEYRNSFYRNLDFSYSNENRISPIIVFSYKINKLFDFDFRTQYQLDIANRNDIREQIRFRPRVKVDVGKRSTVNLSYEAFIIFDIAYTALRRERFGIEYSTEFFKDNNIEISYIYQYQLNEVNPVTDNVIRLSYSYNLN